MLFLGLSSRSFYKLILSSSIILLVSPFSLIVLHSFSFVQLVFHHHFTAYYTHTFSVWKSDGDSHTSRIVVVFFWRAVIKQIENTTFIEFFYHFNFLFLLFAFFISVLAVISTGNFFPLSLVLGFSWSFFLSCNVCYVCACATVCEFILFSFILHWSVLLPIIIIHILSFNNLFFCHSATLM